MGQLTELTHACISAGGYSEEQEGSWLWDVTDYLLDAWLALLLQDSSRSGAFSSLRIEDKPMTSCVHARTQIICTPLFHHVMQNLCPSN